jgi:meso-butanediol dehydrogenase / (S,S)-butanediol dehydrogenase / diacetyl reductase
MEGLAGKRVIVTGGTSGIGEATSRRFIAEGAYVIAFGFGDDEVKTAGDRMPGLAGALQVDVADPAQVEDVFKQADGIFGSLTELTSPDILINNAGISSRHAFLDIAARDWQRMIDVNLNGMFYCAQQAARRMAERGVGTILMTASTNGMVAHPMYADYNASKAGVILLTRTMALELAPVIRVNCICPGYVLTPMQEAEYTPEMLAATDEKIPLRRHARPDEIAALFAYLASTEGAYITGAAITVDGGETAGGLASRNWIRPAL